MDIVVSFSTHFGCVNIDIIFRVLVSYVLAVARRSGGYDAAVLSSRSRPLSAIAKARNAFNICTTRYCFDV